MIGLEILRDAYSYAVLSAIFALLLQSRVPLYIGAFIFLTDGGRIEKALGAIGIRFDPEKIGPDVIKGFVSLFGWFALLASLRDSMPAWLAAWMPSGEPPWSVVAGFALAFALVESLATRTLLRVLPVFGKTGSRGLNCATIKLALVIGAFVLLVLLWPR